MNDDQITHNQQTEGLCWDLMKCLTEILAIFLLILNIFVKSRNGPREMLQAFYQGRSQLRSILHVSLYVLDSGSLEGNLLTSAFGFT